MNTPAPLENWLLSDPRAAYNTSMNRLRQDDIEQARRLTPEEKARQALEMMRAAVRLKRSGLRARYPDESEEQIDRRVREWLIADD